MSISADDRSSFVNADSSGSLLLHLRTYFDYLNKVYNGSKLMSVWRCGHSKLAWAIFLRNNTKERCHNLPLHPPLPPPQPAQVPQQINYSSHSEATEFFQNYHHHHHQVTVIEEECALFTPGTYLFFFVEKIFKIDAATLVVFDEESIWQLITTSEQHLAFKCSHSSPVNY
ncbi:Lactonohydrolase oryH [Trichinella spiralis]|uniref:Lactonohydrolase oryH n=1 Tax=Trichinella spiralis TaxID=6334 RepID=A0ABR3KTX4_TRISP